MHRVVAPALLFLLTACVPAPYGPYYKPSYPAPSATLVKQYCGGHAGPPSILKFSLADNVGFTVSTSEHHASENADELSLTIKLDIPADTQIQFLSNAITVSDKLGDKGRLHQATFEVSGSRSLNQADVVDINQYSPVPTPALEKLLRAYPEQATSETHVDFTLGNSQFHPQALTLDLPEISVGHETVLLPSLALAANRQNKGWWRYETTAHQQARHQRYQHCVEQTPHLACNNLLEIIDESFKENIADFEINGRVYIADFVENPRLTGRLNLLGRSLTPWQFKTAVIRAEDNVTGETYHYEIENFSVFFGWYQLPLDTEVRGIQSNSTGTTTARINVRLAPKSQRQFFIQLPPMLINGEIHELQPIELKLKLFDGGLEPFNC